MDAIRAHGALAGGALAAKRICRCHPWGGCGHDPVPKKRNSECGNRNSGARHLIFHGQNRNHRCFDLRRAALVLVFRADQTGAEPAGLASASSQAATNAVATAQSQSATTTAGAVSSAPAATPGFSFDTNAPEQLLVLTNGATRALHVHVARRRFEAGGTAGLSRNNFRALDKNQNGQQRGGFIEHGRAGARAGGAGRHQSGRRRQFHADAERATACARKNCCRTACG